MGNETVSHLTRLPACPRGNAARGFIAGTAAAVAACIIPVAHADIEIGNGLSVAGFVDMSIVSSKFSGLPREESAALDQVEFNFMFDGSAGVSARVDLEYNDYDGTFVEQAFITKSFTDQFSIKAGRFLSYSGWEAEEPTGLFQYSGTGYAPYFYGYYQNGISAKYDAGMFAFMGSVVTSAFDPYDTDVGDLGFELGVAVQPVEGLTAKLFFIKDQASDTEIFNFWTSYEIGGLTLAGEYNTADYAGGAEGDGYLLMANYATGPWGITLRYHDFDVDGAADTSGFTLSPSYKVGENLLLVAEARRDKFSGGGKANTFALEALFTF